MSSNTPIKTKSELEIRIPDRILFIGRKTSEHTTSAIRIGTPPARGTSPV
jgi:hypothetical protein